MPDATSTGDDPEPDRADAAPSAEGWEPVPGVGEPVERVELDDIERLTELTHPVRGPIMRRLKEPRTVAEIAAALDVPVTRLYHHVNRLEELGLVHVVATRRVGAVTERRYQAVARSFRLAASAFSTLDTRDLAVALGSLFDVAKIEFQHTIEHGDVNEVDAFQDRATLSLGEIHLTDARRRELVRRLLELQQEFTSNVDEDDPAAIRTALFVATFPATR
jgi:DNA-binding transcriptional ArsR family regulator